MGALCQDTPRCLPLSFCEKLDFGVCQLFSSPLTQSQKVCFQIHSLNDHTRQEGAACLTSSTTPTSPRCRLCCYLYYVILHCFIKIHEKSPVGRFLMTLEKPKNARLWWIQLPGGGSDLRRLRPFTGCMSYSSPVLPSIHTSFIATHYKTIRVIMELNKRLRHRSCVKGRGLNVYLVHVFNQPAPHYAVSVSLM